MSVLIKGMEMPTDCHNCPLGFGGGCYCGTSADEYMCPDHGRAEWCPLVPVPPHGRLIDADALIIALETQDYSCAPDTLEEWTPMDMTKAEIADIRNAPTIIPADESAKTEEDTDPWLCLSCRHYPPSSTDGKPCSQCNPSEVWHSCYDPAEEGE